MIWYVTWLLLYLLQSFVHIFVPMPAYSLQTEIMKEKESYSRIIDIHNNTNIIIEYILWILLMIWLVYVIHIDFTIRTYAAWFWLLILRYIIMVIQLKHLPHLPIAREVFLLIKAVVRILVKTFYTPISKTMKYRHRIFTGSAKIIGSLMTIIFFAHSICSWTEIVRYFLAGIPLRLWIDNREQDIKFLKQPSLKVVLEPHDLSLVVNGSIANGKSLNIPHVFPTHEQIVQHLREQIIWNIEHYIHLHKQRIHRLVSNWVKILQCLNWMLHDEPHQISLLMQPV